MRKTLTVLTLITTAISLAACKMPWDPEPKPAAAIPSATETAYTALPSTEPATPATTAAATPGATPAVK